MIPNPFSHDIVRNPHDSPVTVSTLNRPVLDSLSAAFAPLVQAPAPRPPIPAPKARLVLSPAPGFGKSHLIARLSAGLGDQATVISFSPFQNAGLCWQSLLLQVVTALHRPASLSGKTRLALFAEDIFRHLLAAALRGGHLQHDHPADAVAWVLDNLTVEPPEDQRNWNPWMHGMFLSQSATWRSILADLRIHPEDDAWLTVLFHYTAAPEHSDQRQHCLAWLQGRSLSPESRAALGLPAHDPAGPDSVSLEALNDLCRRRLHDLCRLAAFHRPFLFCFDQTEVFARDETLARTFGRVIAELVNELPHQMTVVTANQGVWDRKIRHAMDEADFHRFHPALHLMELTRAEGEELIALLTRSHADQTAPLARVTDPEWLASLFPGAGGSMPAREFLHRCQRRWEHAGPDARDAPAGPAGLSPSSGPAVPEKTGSSLASRFEALLIPQAAGAADPPGCDPDVFRWLAGTALARPGESSPVEHSEDFAEIIWRLPRQAVLRFNFAHASSESHSIWRQLAEYAQENGRRDHVPVSKLILFRPPDLQHCPIPRDSWRANAPAIRSARAACLHLIELTPAETAGLQAARQLHLEAQDGGFEGFSEKDALDFLAEKLAPWRDRLLAPLSLPATPTTATTAPTTATATPTTVTIAPTTATTTAPPDPARQANPSPSAVTGPAPASSPAPASAAPRPTAGRPVLKPGQALRPAVLPKTAALLRPRLQPPPSSGLVPGPVLVPGSGSGSGQPPAQETALSVTAPIPVSSSPEARAADSVLTPRILEILKAEKFLSLEALTARLGGRLTSAHVLEACRALSGIEIQPSPDCTLLIWQG